jgi:hypothetical protein
MAKPCSFCTKLVKNKLYGRYNIHKECWKLHNNLIYHQRKERMMKIMLNPEVREAVRQVEEVILEQWKNEHKS